MRMWMVDPRQMCRKHLLGEHVECHMFYAILLKKQSINGYIINNCLEVTALKSRHDALAEEIFHRGYQHHSPINQMPDISYLNEKIIKYHVKVEDSETDLKSRCKECFNQNNKNIR
jgi:hypothetical protein